MASEWLTSEQAARRLGVKAETLYAYVSRGLIRSERIDGSRRSRFHAGDVARHAARSRTGGRAGALEVIVETKLTLLDPGGRLAYRGWDVADAVRTSTYEAVATWLWTGENDPVPFRPTAASAAMAKHFRDDLGLDCPPVDRWRALLGPLRTLDPLRTDRRADAVAATGRTLVATLLEAMDVHGRAVDASASVAERLWPRLTGAPPSGGRIRALDGALVLLADHELASSTLAARVAASTHADPYLVVSAGLAVLGGPLHGGAAAQARTLLEDAGPDGADAAPAIGRVLELDRLLPGFGHAVYETADPRAELLLDLLADARCIPPAAEAVLSIARDRRLPFANIDFALATFAEACDFTPGALEALFCLARIVGWLAHAIEEYEHRLRFRTRAAYTGPRPAEWS